MSELREQIAEAVRSTFAASHRRTELHSLPDMLAERIDAAIDAGFLTIPLVLPNRGQQKRDFKRAFIAAMKGA